MTFKLIVVSSDDSAHPHFGLNFWPLAELLWKLCNCWSRHRCWRLFLAIERSPFICLWQNRVLFMISKLIFHYRVIYFNLKSPSSFLQWIHFTIWFRLQDSAAAPRAALAKRHISITIYWLMNINYPIHLVRRCCRHSADNYVYYLPI